MNPSPNPLDQAAAAAARRLLAWAARCADPDRRPWLAAVRAELDAIPGGGAQLAWALGGLRLVWCDGPAGGPAWRAWLAPGLGFGAVLSGFWLLWNGLYNLLPVGSPLQSAFQAMAFGGYFFMPPLGCGLAGFAGGRRSRTVRAGTYAGLLAWGLSSLIMVGSMVLFTVLFLETARSNALQDPGMIQDFQRAHSRTFDEFLIGDNLGAALVLTGVTLIQGIVAAPVCALLGVRTRGAAPARPGRQQPPARR